MKLKQKLYDKCLELLNLRLQVIKNKIKDLQKALESETKSSAGDKHETGRAMIQLDREKAGNQLAELQKQLEIIHKVNPSLIQNKIALGSIVNTTKSNFFIAVSIGEVKLEGQFYYCVSAATPMGKALLSKQVGETITFGKEKFDITQII